MRTSNELQIGKAGEYIVCADLILKGLIAYPSEQGLPYDVVLDNGFKLLKIQVKTTQCPRTVPQRNKDMKAYIFNIKRNGKGGKKKYSDGEIDIFALVCLDTKQVGYLFSYDMPETINIRVDSLRGSYYDEKGIVDFEKALSLKGTMSQTAIAKKLGLHVSQVNRMFMEGFTPHKSSARYFSDFNRQKEWFYVLH